ncbi:MAG: NOB1 family endonuclease [Promethearchaeota archaeon]
MGTNFYILDNTAFAAGLNLNILEEDSATIFLTTPEIIEEAQKNKKSSQMLSIALFQNKIQLYSPSNSSISYVKKQAQQSGDIGALSEPDISILSLAYEWQKNNPEAEVLLISDDYSVQNTAEFLKISFKPLQQDGIRHKISWEVFCPHCFRRFSPLQLGKTCPICGAKLKRRRKKEK